MSAQNNLNGQQFDPYVDDWPGSGDDYPEPDEKAWNPAHLFHGTNKDMKPGDMIAPGNAPNFAHLGAGARHAYATSRLSHAATYAETAAYGQRKGVPRVYEVEPSEDMLPDPEEGSAFGNGYADISPSDWRSPTGFRVKGRVPSKAVKKTRGGQWDNDYKPNAAGM